MRVFALLCLALAAAEAGLPMESRCGDTLCDKVQYCSDFDRQCRNCSDVCLESSHNYEQRTCESKCQYYIHDVRYMNLRSTENNHPDLAQKVDLIVALLVVVAVLQTIMILAGFAYVLKARVPRWKTKLLHSIVKGKTVKEHGGSNGYFGNVSMKRVASMEDPSGLSIVNVRAREAEATRRYPCEEACPAGCYDNAGMSQVSPSFSGSSNRWAQQSYARTTTTSLNTFPGS